MKTIKEVKKAVESGADKQRENSGDQVFLDWCITYSYIPVIMNREYILTSKSPNRRECQQCLQRFHERIIFCWGCIAQ